MNYWSYVGITFIVSKEQAFNNVCKVFQVTPIELRSRRRFRHIVDAKGVLCYILHKKQGLSCLAVAEYMNLNHATILHHCNKVEGLLETDKEFREKFKLLRTNYN